MTASNLTPSEWFTHHEITFDQILLSEQFQQSIEEAAEDLFIEWDGDLPDVGSHLNLDDTDGTQRCRIYLDQASNDDNWIYPKVTLTTFARGSDSTVVWGDVMLREMYREDNDPQFPPIDEEAQEARRERAREAAEAREVEKERLYQRERAIMLQGEPDETGHLIERGYENKWVAGMVFRDGKHYVPLGDSGVQVITSLGDGKADKKIYGTKKGNYVKVGYGMARYITEGIATACAVYKATGYACIAAIDAGNLKEVAKHYPNAIVAVDWDEAGIKCAIEAGLPMVFPEMDGDKYDFDDMLRKRGVTATREALEDISLPNAIKALSHYVHLAKKQSAVPKLCVDVVNCYHSVMLHGSNIMINSRAYSDLGWSVTAIPKRTFTEMYRNLTVMGIKKTKAGDEVLAPFSAVLEWYESDKRTTYHNGFYCDPSMPNVRGAYNMWRGLAVNPIAGTDKIEKIIEHIRDNVCQGNEEYYQYAMSWLAHMFQNPNQKPAVAMVLRGNEKGSGKSTIGNILSNIIGADHSVTVSHSSQVVGQFNSHLAHKLFINLEEALLAGDGKNDAILKDLISRDMMMLEGKGKDAIPVRAFHRVLMTSNSNWVVPATKGERRYFVLDVAPNFHKSTMGVEEASELWRGIYQDLEEGGYGQFLNLMLEWDISEFDPFNCPDTEGLAAQISNSVDHHGRAVLCLFESFGSQGSALAQGQDGIEFSNHKMHNAYCDFFNGHRNDMLHSASFKRLLKEIFPDARYGQKVHNYDEFGTRDGSNRVNGVKLMVDIEEAKRMVHEFYEVEYLDSSE